MLSFDPAEHPQRQIYKLMTGIIVPRPIALVSTMDAAGNANLAPFSFFAGVGSAPPTVLFLSRVAPGRSRTGRPTQRHTAQRGRDRASLWSTW